MFECLQANGLIIRPDKCHFGLETISFLGHKVSAQGTCPLPTKVAAVVEFPLPSTSWALSQFLGLVNYFHRFIPGAANILHPLHTLVDHSHPGLINDWPNDGPQYTSALWTTLAASLGVSLQHTSAHHAQSKDWWSASTESSRHLSTPACHLHPGRNSSHGCSSACVPVTGPTSATFWQS